MTVAATRSSAAFGASPVRGLVGDVLLVVLVLAVDITVGGNLLKDDPDPGWRVGASFAVATSVAAAVAVRRWWPVPALAVALGAGLAGAVLGVLWDPFLGAALVACQLALSQPRRPARYALVCSLVAVAVGTIAGEVLRPTSAWWFGIGVPLVLGCWQAGRMVAEQRRQAVELERQREHRIVVDERLHIARELHDVLTHGMGLIAVQAGVANHLASSRPEAVGEALRTIETTSREALAETRRLVSALREDSGREPTPGLEGLAGLVEAASGAGVRVELFADGAPGGFGDVPRTVQLAAFRIVQEAVTNVMAHAAPATCRVHVWAEGGVVRAEVVDDGTQGPRSTGRPGHGLAGMRERTAMYGGTFTAGPLPEGGFGVSVALPYPPIGAEGP
ncbi:sensor histidine kinase [Pseudonocardia sp. MH-G8]|uniref:sensor histidine kinase n=1 Tax=Pseudonocardia sp. MH-G8 TaxID=1854588 RepID=UPI000BA127B7|nr:sensor histidine kinase [Pseudonocardia sp. MH-G8]OZM83880.1 hypothetical protein CFP66_05390 [Pseudonocardia sp. MH-G8]